MNEFYDKLDELYQAGDLTAVEDFLLDTIAGTGSLSPERAGLLNELGGFYRGVSRYSESEETFRKSLELFESIDMSATPEYATVLLNLAGLYRIKGEVDKAIELFFGAMKKLEDAGAYDSYAYVSILNNLALAYQTKDEPEQALEYAVKALEKMRTGLGSEHEIASSLNNLAAIHLRLGELDAADSLISEALEIYDAMEETNVHHAAALTTKSVLMCRRGDYNDSLIGFRRALELTGRFFGENIEFAICKRNISEVCELLGDIPMAVAELSDSLRIMKQLLGPDHPSVKTTQAKLEKLMRSAERKGLGVRD